MYGCETSRLRLRDKKDGPGETLSPLSRRVEPTGAPRSLSMPVGGHRIRAALGAVLRAGFQQRAALWQSSDAFCWPGCLGLTATASLRFLCPHVCPVLLPGSFISRTDLVVQRLALPLSRLVSHQCYELPSSALGTGEFSRHSVSYISVSTFPERSLSMKVQSSIPSFLHIHTQATYTSLSNFYNLST